MTRSILTILGAGAFIAVVVGTGCKAAGVGDPCTPEEEYLANFAGFTEDEVNVESKSFQCQTRLCLANHFRGRVSCPYGQNADASGLPGGDAFDPDPSLNPPATACVVPGSMTPIDPTLGPDGKTPLNPIPKSGKTVQAQCVDRRTALAVYCSCRCADINGGQGGNQTYCSCPDGFTCTQLVTSIGTGDTGLTGAYCIKQNTEFSTTGSCAQSCDPTSAPCHNET